MKLHDYECGCGHKTWSLRKVNECSKCGNKIESTEVSKNKNKLFKTERIKNIKEARQMVEIAENQFNNAVGKIEIDNAIANLTAAKQTLNRMLNISKSQVV